MKITKRNGLSVNFDISKIETAIFKSYQQVSDEDIDPAKLQQIAKRVKNILTRMAKKQTVSVEIIQDIVEKQIMAEGDDVSFNAAKAYILHREERAKLRNLDNPNNNDLCKNFIFTQKYARYIPSKKRRETYIEAVDRVCDMHLKRYKHFDITDQIKDAFKLVKQQKVLPSMRSMQFGGKPIEVNHLRMYNCSSTPIDDYTKFAEILYVLLCGVGVGWSVEYQYVEKLSKLKDSITTSEVSHHIVDDSIEGWADAILALMESYFITGKFVEFSYHNIRPQGARLVTSGGKAPGHLGLKQSIEKIRKVLSARCGNTLRPVDCHDICCHLSDAVLSGGIRRSAAIALFSVDDMEMMTCKTGDWFNVNPQRARANNSCRLIKGEYTEAQIRRLALRAKDFGDPGLFFVNKDTVLTNPCGEITMEPFIGDKTGFGFCNLTEVNVAACTDYKDLEVAARAASFIGTLQAGYTEFPYLRQESRDIAKRDALLGVSLTGMMDQYELIFNPMTQRNLALAVVDENIRVAKLININPAKRCTTVKPSGTASIIIGCVSNGIHPRHSKRYFRRSQQNVNDPVYQYFKKDNGHMCESSIWSNTGTDEVVTFCIEAPITAKFRDDFSAIDLLDHVILTRKNWIKFGSTDESGLTHNISNTITVREDEWSDVIDYVWKYRKYLSGISFFSYYPDKGKQSPFEAVDSETEDKYWTYLLNNCKNVDFTQLIETEDNTKLKETVACAGGACNIL